MQYICIKFSKKHFKKVTTLSINSNTDNNMHSGIANEETRGNCFAH